MSIIKMRGPIDVLFAFKIFSLPVPTCPGTRTFLQVPDLSCPEVKNPYPSTIFLNCMLFFSKVTVLKPGLFGRGHIHNWVVVNVNVKYWNQLPATYKSIRFPPLEEIPFFRTVPGLRLWKCKTLRLWDVVTLLLAQTWNLSEVAQVALV